MILLAFLDSYANCEERLRRAMINAWKDTCQQEGEDNATNEKPFASIEGDIDATIDSLTLCVDFVGPV